MNGILNINKPKGVSSNYIVTKVKKILHTKKVGHFGTLDPMASGVLPIGVNKATKLFDYFLLKDKAYEAIFTFGYETDTLDAEGQILVDNQPIPTKEMIEGVLPSLLGEINQIPPIFSAKMINGVRAYDLARKGVDFELKPKKITIYKLDLISQENSNSFKFYIHCSSGTYIRSIARDLAEKLSTKATMTSLIRIKAGIFELENAVELNENLQDNLLPLEKVLNELPRIDIPDNYFDKLSNGIKIPVNQEFEKATIYCKDILFGIGKSIDGKLHLITYLRGDL